MIDVRERLQTLGWKLPPAPKPVATYVPSLLVGDLLYVSGQLPRRDNKMAAVGAVPTAASVEQAQEAAGQCVVNALAVVDDALGGDWGRFVRIVRLGVFVQSADGFGDQPKVANGASDLLVAVLGDAGKHVRAAVGVNALPGNVSVEVELVAQVRPA